YGIPVVGTMAHSYVLAHGDELSAFRAFVRAFPTAMLLVDTYDTLGGVRNVIRLAKELGKDFKVKGVRLDSGDLVMLAAKARQHLDSAGLTQVEIFASSGIEEKEILQFAEVHAPIAGFGVGASLAVSHDAPNLDMAYKLVAYAGQGRMKLSPEKENFPLQKQVFRVSRGSRTERDILASHEERLEGEPLPVPSFTAGRRRSAPARRAGRPG